ncbi:MAG TPA: hypothetical protein QF772_02925 [Nitrospinaceae bacterium]|jgi:hypothetical protein|nr:hypothetical protein [Nitrospinaceae bacterium]HJO57160.1 hypothetical protein [Nitrospinaceae bacterium]|tara:strand:+ start:3369 stop:4007 length:639 start_codon:yes stop_codon:yes gene_type:complete
MFNNKTKYIIGALGICSILLVGCAKETTTAPAAAEAAAPSMPERPDWVYNEPSEDDGILSFVGMSAVHASEQNARNDARRNATNNVVQYLGTMAKTKFEQVTQSYGLSSQIVDPTTAAQQFEKQMSANLAREMKTKTWHPEREKKSGVWGYKYFVLAEIPKASIENSFRKSLDQNIKKQQEEAEKAATQKAKEQSENAIDMFRKMKKEGLME